MPTRILVVEDRDSLRRMLAHALRGEGYTVVTAATGEAGIATLDEGGVDLVLTDLKLPGASGLDVLEAAGRRLPTVPVVVLTAFGSVATAVEAMKRGAVDFLEKPVELDDLFELVRSHLAESPGAAFEPPGGPALVGRHPLFRAALRLLRKVAPTESTVLLTGESGTGKELFARALHALSKRADGPFVAVNCAAIPEPLMENELFGHEKGAFTGAGERQRGRFELAGGGTLLLDEIGELGPGVQGKVLRVLEERVFERVGSGRPVVADVRIVAATNRDLQAMVEEGTFRQDLFYRLDVFPLELPPLRERPSDIPDLARHLVATIARRLERPPPELAPDALETLAARPWPGNVRQLANALERALILHERGPLRTADLQGVLEREPPPEEPERERVREALIEADGDKARAAEILGISRRTLQRRIKAFDLAGVPRYRE